MSTSRLPVVHGLTWWFCRDLTQNRIRRGIFGDAEELIVAIGDFIDKHNRRPKPFVWTGKTSDILER